MKQKKTSIVNTETGEVVNYLTPFKTQYNAKQFLDLREINNQPSETIPDQSMSISEILRRFASGLPIDGARVESYDEGEDILDGVNWQTLDLAEKAAFVDNVKAELKYLQDNYDNEQKLKKRKAAIEWQEKQKQNQGTTVLEKVPTKDDQGTNSDKG